MAEVGRGERSDVRYIAQHRCHINYSFDINFLMTNDKLWYNASMNCLVCAMKRRLNHGNDKETILRFG